MSDLPENVGDSLANLRERINVFVNERDWAQFHSPKNLVMAMIVEAAELVEHFQWKTEQQSRELTPEKRDRKSTRLNSSHLRLSRMPSSA